MRVRANGLLALAALGLAVGSAGGAAIAAPPTTGPAPAVTTTSAGLVVDWDAPWPRFEARADGTWDATLAGFTPTSRPGWPQVPFASVLLALPPDAQPVVQIQSNAEAEVTVPGPLALAPAPATVARDAAGQPLGGAFVLGGENAAALTFPDQPLLLTEVGVAGGVRLARLTFYPLHRAGTGWRVTTHLRAAIQFNAPLSSPLAPRASNLVVAAVQSEVINPGQVERAPAAPAGPALQLASSGIVTAAIEVNTPGLTAITYAALAGAGFPVTTTNPANLHLVRAGTEIALQWDGNGNAAFEPGERLLFYAQPRFSRWTTTDVYWLYADGGPGRRMSTRSAAPAGLIAGSAWVTQTAEVNALYTPQCYCGLIPAGRDGDHWAWDSLSQPGRPTGAYPLRLPTVAATQPATLTVWLIGYTLLNHRVDVRVNGTQVGSALLWSGQQGLTATLHIAPGLLARGPNTVTVTLPGLPGVPVDGVWLDAFAVSYARGVTAQGNGLLFTGAPSQRAYTVSLTATTGLRAYDVTLADQPVSLTGVALNGSAVTVGDAPAGGPRRYALAAADAIRTPAAIRLAQGVNAVAGASYLVITTPDFEPALASLRALRQTQGLTVAIQDVQPIYDTFGDGRPDPAAIQAFVSQAYHAWSPRPAYLLLVGGGTYDPKHYLPTSSDTYIPPYLADVDPWMGETATDNRYVTVDGADDLPDLLVGRLPVNTLLQAQTVVNKIVAYETQPAPGLWNHFVDFVADSPDQAGDFAGETSQLAANEVPAPYWPQLYDYRPPTTTAASLHQAILAEWNAGASLLAFTGHASIHQWSAGRLFHVDDLASLTNGARLPVVLELTCFTGTFADPGSATLDEALVRQAGGGAVAVWGATGLGVSTGHQSLASGFLHALYVTGQPGLGAATLAGKLALAATGQNLDLLDTYLLLGDPATRLDLTLVPGSRIFVPLVGR